MKVGVLGSRGYVGRAIFSALKDDSNHSAVGITRENYYEHKEVKFDVLINAAMPSRRFWAKNNPANDFNETVQKTADMVYGWQYDKFIQVSSVSARCQLDTVYGRHKAAAEKLIDTRQHLIVRLGPMYSEDLEKGVLVDILTEETVYADASSRYCFAPRDFIAQWITSHLDAVGLKEVGARDSISLQEVSEALEKKVVFDGAVDHQEIVDPEENFPDAADVITFMKNWNIN